MDYEDAEVQDTTDKEERYKSQLDTLMRWGHQKMVNSKDKAKSNKMDMGGVAGKGGWDQQPEQQQHDHSMGMMRGKGYYPKEDMGMAKVGQKDGTQAREQKEDSKEEKAKGGIQEHTSYKKEKGKECKERAGTLDKLDVQQGYAHNHQKEKAKGRA